MSEPREYKKVYVVSWGYMDDYVLGGIFSTEDKAKASMELSPETDWNEIEEIDLDSTEKFFLDDPVTLPVYEVWINLSDGSVRKWGERCNEVTLNRGRHNDDSRLGCGNIRGEIDSAYGSSPTSPERALELAREAREKWLKEQQNKKETS